MKLKLPFLFLLLVCYTQLLHAQPQVYNSNNGTAAYGIPFNQGASGFNRAQFLMQKDYFPLTASGNITAIYLRPGGTVGTSYNLSGLSVSIGSTFLYNYSTSPVFNYATGLTNVYTATNTNVTVLAGGWIKIPLQTPYAYDGRKNIVIDMSVQNAAFSLFSKSVQGSNNPTMYGSTSASAPNSTSGLVYDFGFDISSSPLPKQNNNAGFATVISPVNGGFCQNTGVQNVTVKLFNAGSNPINSITIGWSVDGKPQPDFNYIGSIDTFSSPASNIVSINLGGGIDFSKGSHDFQFYTSQPNGVADPYTDNDTLSLIIAPIFVGLQIVPGSYPFICPGAPVNVVLTPTGGGINYNWTYNNGSTSYGVQASPTAQPYTAKALGTYAVTANINGCTVGTFIKIDSFRMPKPFINPFKKGIVCKDDSIKLSVLAPLGGTIYQWRSGGIDITGATDTIFHSKTGGDFTLWASKYGCADSSDTTKVSEKPAPSPTITNKNNYLQADTTAIIHYQWYVNADTVSVAIPGDTFSVCAPKKVGAYSVLVYNGGCYRMSQPFNIDSSFLAVADIEAVKRIRIYPNPASSQLFVDAPSYCTIFIAGIDGRILLQQSLDYESVDISILKQGMYMVQLKDKNGVLLKTHKLIKISD